MGRSYTAHVVGIAEKIEEDGVSIEYQTRAMTKLEMAQKKKIMEDEGHPIKAWYAQTKTGCKMIGASNTLEVVPDSKVNHIKTIPCPICYGQGVYVEDGITYGCPVCNGSGITKKNHWLKWDEWQLEAIQKAVKKYKEAQNVSNKK